MQALEKRQHPPGEMSGSSHPPPFSDPPSQGSRKKRRGKQRRTGKKSPAMEDEGKGASCSARKEIKKKKLATFPQFILKMVQNIEVGAVRLY